MTRLSVGSTRLAIDFFEFQQQQRIGVLIVFSSFAYPQSEQEIVLQKMSNQHIRIAVVGNVDAGKSTMIGSLVSSTLDDGRGMARSTIMRHKHEQDTGRTSTIGVNLLGLDDQYQTVSGDYKEVVLKSNRLVSLMDLAGVSRN